MKHILLAGCLLLLQACQGAAKEEGVELSLTNPVAEKAVAATREDFDERLGAEKNPIGNMRITYPKLAITILVYGSWGIGFTLNI